MIQGFIPEEHLGVSVVHVCGHDHRRPIKALFGKSRKWEFVPSPTYLRSINASAESILEVETIYRERVSIVHDHWQKELCPDCWKKSKRVRRWRIG